jgi:hypothetical protein
MVIICLQIKNKFHKDKKKMYDELRLTIGAFINL